MVGVTSVSDFTRARISASLGPNAMKGTGLRVNYFTDSHMDANLAPNNGYIKDKAYLAVATGYDAESGIAEFTQRNKMCKGDPAELLTPGRIGRELTIGEIFDENMNPIESTPHPYMKFFMRVPFEIREGDILRAR